MNHFLGISAFVISVLITGCAGRGETKVQEEEQSYPTIQLTSQSTTIDHDYASNLEAVQNVEVRARIEGYLDKILVDEGKPVKKG